MAMEVVVRKVGDERNVSRVVVGNHENGGNDWFASPEKTHDDMFGWSSGDYSSMVVPRWWRIVRLTTAVEPEPRGQHREGVEHWIFNYNEPDNHESALRVDIRHGGHLIVRQGQETEIEVRHMSPEENTTVR